MHRSLKVVTGICQSCRVTVLELPAQAAFLPLKIPPFVSAVGLNGLSLLKLPGLQGESLVWT